MNEHHKALIPYLASHLITENNVGKTKNPKITEWK